MNQYSCQKPHHEDKRTLQATLKKIVIEKHKLGNGHITLNVTTAGHPQKPNGHAGGGRVRAAPKTPMTLYELQASMAEELGYVGNTVHTEHNVQALYQSMLH